MNSVQATHFRIWATERLKEQLARVREIRSSERRFYQKITYIYSQCSADYNVDAKVTKRAPHGARGLKRQNKKPGR